MSGVLIDTNILIDYLRNISPAVQYLENTPGRLSISALTVAELHAGARNESEKKSLRGFTASFDVIPADAAICEVGGDLRAEFAPSHGIDLIDGIIAATSMIKELPFGHPEQEAFSHVAEPGDSLSSKLIQDHAGPVTPPPKFFLKPRLPLPGESLIFRTW